MISSLKTDLVALKEAIRYNIEHPSTNNNTESYQICLDLLTRFPLNSAMSTSDFLEFFDKSSWLQYVHKDSNFSLINSTKQIRKGAVTAIDNVRYSNNTLYYNTKTFNESISELFKQNSEVNIFHNLGENKQIKLDNVYDRFEHRIDKFIYSNIYNNDIYTFGNYYKYRYPKLLDPRYYNALQLPTDKLNYYINKYPFTIKETPDSDIISSSTYIFPKLESEYDIIIYPNKIVFMSASRLSSSSMFKVFSIPSLELIESGTDVRSNIYNKLKLTRSDIVGPNIYRSSISGSNPQSNLRPIHIQNGFRCHNSNFYDIYMNSVKISEKFELMIRRVEVGNLLLNLYF